MKTSDNPLFKKETVRVLFINALDESRIGVSEVPVDQLPQTFKLSTTMMLKGDKWSIEAATPMHSKEFLKTRHLELKLRKIKKIKPKKLLFSLPSISAELPEITASNNYAGKALSIKEDDWRQHEFLNKSAASLIKVECDKIESVRQDFSKKLNDTFTAYTQCHIRNTIGAPKLAIKLIELSKVLGSKEITGLKFAGTDSFVLNGFSITTTNAIFFGLEEGGLVSTLCVRNLSNDTIDDVQTVLEQFDLVSVDWCAGAVEWKRD